MPSTWIKFVDRGGGWTAGARDRPARPGWAERGRRTAPPTAPAFKFTSSPDTGIFSPGGGKIALAENG